MNAILGVIKDGVSKEGVDIYVIAEATGNEAYFLVCFSCFCWNFLFCFYYYSDLIFLLFYFFLQEMKAIIPNLQFIQGGPDTVMRDLEMMAQVRKKKR